MACPAGHPFMKDALLTPRQRRRAIKKKNHSEAVVRRNGRVT